MTINIFLVYHYESISIHTASEGGDIIEKHIKLFEYISIHTASEGGDCTRNGWIGSNFLFQSTPPAKAVTFLQLRIGSGMHISIHTASEGGDTLSGGNPKYDAYFNPHRQRRR